MEGLPEMGPGGIPLKPAGMDDLYWKRLLEELYPDKKYLDYAYGKRGCNNI
jgi:hypothetical protein